MLTCAYTAKVVKFGKMMTALGHEVFLYSGEENEAVCSEHIAVVKRDERIAGSESTTRTASGVTSPGTPTRSRGGR